MFFVGMKERLLGKTPEELAQIAKAHGLPAFSVALLRYYLFNYSAIAALKVSSIWRKRW